MFKLGDMVQVKPDCKGSNGGTLCAGQIGTIKEIQIHDLHEHLSYVILDLPNSWSGIWMHELQSVGIVEEDFEYV